MRAGRAAAITLLAVALLFGGIQHVHPPKTSSLWSARSLLPLLNGIASPLALLAAIVAFMLLAFVRDSHRSAAIWLALLLGLALSCVV